MPGPPAEDLNTQRAKAAALSIPLAVPTCDLEGILALEVTFTYFESQNKSRYNQNVIS